MVTPNSQNRASESSENTQAKNSNKVTLDGLLIEGIIREFGDPIDPSVYNKYKLDSIGIDETIREHMKDIRSEGMKEWSEVSDEEIDGLSKERIAERLPYYLLPFAEKRRKALERVSENYPVIKNESGWRKKLEKSLETLSEIDLVNLASKKPLMRKIVDSTFPGMSNQSPREQSNFQEAFYDIDSLNITPNNKAEIKKIYTNYIRLGYFPDSYDIAKILSAYSFASNQRKRELLGYFEATIDLEFASRYSLLTDMEVEDIATENFGDLFGRLKDTEKTRFIRNLKKRKDIRIPFSELNSGNLDELFQNPKKRQELAETILESVGIRGERETDNSSSTVMGKMKKLRESDDGESEGSPHMDPLYTFGELLKKDVAQEKNKKIPIQGLEKLTVGSIVRFGDTENVRYFRIKQSLDENNIPLDTGNGLDIGVLLEGLPVEDGVIREKQPTLLDYESLYRFFTSGEENIVIMSADEFRTQVLTSSSGEAGKDGKIFDASDLGETIDASNILAKLDSTDTEGRSFGLSEGTYFEAPEEEKNGKSEMRVWKVVKVHGNFVDIANIYGMKENNIPLEEIYAQAKAGKLKRVSRIPDADSFVNLLSKDYGVSDHAHLEGSDIIEKHTDASGKEEKHAVKCFSGKNGHIRIGGIEDGVVYFGEFKGGEVSKAQEYAEKKGVKKAETAYYQPRQLTYGAFLAYLKENNLEASSGDILLPHAHHEDHDGHHDPHLHNSLISKLGQMQSINSMWKGVEMIWHSIEHNLEKGSKLDAAKFAMGVSKYMPAFDGVQAQIYADIVDESKKVVEQYKNKIFNLPGPRGRLKCIHIVHNKDARPEEVAAAIQYMVSSYGHLYSEDIKEYQSVVNKKNLEMKPDGYFAFLDAFIRSAKLPARDGKTNIIYWRKKAFDKAINELGGEKGHEGNPPEEQLLHALFKSIDGNPEDFPYAASVVKAVGGPSGFEKDWKFEGYKNAAEKGRTQTTMVNAQGRLNKAIGYLSTHEIYKAMGAMEKVAGKVKYPEYQAVPFVWAVGGYTKYASPTAIQDLKNYAENGLSFHAFAFLRKEEDNVTYRNTVRLAVEELIKQGKMEQSDLAEFDALCKRFDGGPEAAGITEKKYNKEPAPVGMMKFWQKNCNKGLNDMLQNKNGWLTVKAKEDASVKKYRNQFVEAHSQNLKDPSIPNALDYGPDWYKEHGYQNVIMGSTEDGLKSVDSMLNKIKFTTTNRGGKPMNVEDKEKIWNYVVKYMDEGLRDDKMFLGEAEIQKEQFLLHRRELIKYFSAQLNANEVKDPKDVERVIGTEGYEYFKDFYKMGIDPHAIFDSTLIEKNAESDFQAWKGGGYGQKGKIDDVIGAIKARANGAERDSGYQRTMNKVTKGVKTTEYRDSDVDSETFGQSSGIDYRNSD